jgi:hypothetical protein
MRFPLPRRVRVGAFAVVVLALAVGGFAYASIPDSDGTIHGCYVKSGGGLRVIDVSVTKCKSNETAIDWNKNGATGAIGPTGATGATGPGIDLTSVYTVTSGTVTVAAGSQGAADADCENGDVPIGGNYGVNGVNFLVYFDGTHIFPDKIGSDTENAGYYDAFLINNNASGGANVVVFSTVYCVPVP